MNGNYMCKILYYIVGIIVEYYVFFKKSKIKNNKIFMEVRFYLG